MNLQRVELDFVAQHRRGSPLGLAILILGTAAFVGALFALHSASVQVQGLELRLDAAARRSAPAASARSAEETDKLIAEVRRVAAELRTPWSVLLEELEQAGKASNGSVAVIGIEPDRVQSKVRLIVEARSFPVAFAYLQQLQLSKALRYPLLDNHEIQTRVSERPVRLQITADWRQAT